MKINLKNEFEDHRANSKAVKIVVIGSSIYDLSIRIPRLPVVGETISGEEYSANVGGKGANQAIGVARLGAQVTFVTSIGDDQFGRVFRQTFQNAGIDDSFCHVDPHTPTGIGIPLVLNGGQNAIVVAPSASRKLPIVAVQAARDKIVSADALLVQLECPANAIAYAIETAKEAKVPIYLDPAPLGEAIEEFVWSADVITPNESEAEVLCHEKVSSVSEALKASISLREKGPSTVIITLGEKGCVASTSTYTGFVPAFKTNTVDTTGAGDAFSSGFAYARCAGADLISALTFANACGALACMMVGGIPAMPIYEAAIELVHSRVERWTE